MEYNLENINLSKNEIKKDKISNLCGIKIFEFNSIEKKIAASFYQSQSWAFYLLL